MVPLHSQNERTEIIDEVKVTGEETNLGVQYRRFILALETYLAVRKRWRKDYMCLQ